MKKATLLSLVTLTIVLLLSFGASAAGSKPIAGFFFGSAGQNVTNSSVIVYVNQSTLDSANPCFTDPRVLSGTDSSFATNLNNLLRNDTGTDCSGFWATGDPIWAEAIGENATPPQGNGTTILAGDTIEAGSGLQFLTNGTLSAPPDTTPPNITLISPANGSQHNTSYNVTFFYNVTDNSTISSCSLIIDGSTNQTDNSVSVNITQNITTFLFNGNYTWSISCIDSATNTGFSQNRSLEVAVPNSPPAFFTPTDDASTALSPTTIGTNVTFTATATDIDQDTYQLVICDNNTINQSGSCGNTTICSSVFVAQGSPASCQHNTTGELPSTRVWFSFVCDGKNCSVNNNANSPYHVNHFPTFTPITNKTFPEDSQLPIFLNETFNDTDGDALTYSSSTPLNITVLINQTTGVATLIPGLNFFGIRIINFTATDEHGLAVTTNNVVLNITPVNDAPNLTAVTLNQTTAKNGTNISITSTGAFDVDTDNLTLLCGVTSGVYDLCNSTLGQPQRSCSFLNPFSDDAAHNLFCIVSDGLLNSTQRNTTLIADNTPPGAATILNVEGDTLAKFWDTDNDSNTVIQLTLTETLEVCRWDTTDLGYDTMNTSNGCTVVGTLASCNVNESIAAQINETTRYISCADQYGNPQNTTQNTDVTFGVDFTIPSINTDNDGIIHLPGFNVTFNITDLPPGTIVNASYCVDVANTCGPNTSLVSGTQVQFNLRGTFFLRFNASDDAGNVNSTQSTAVLINSLLNISNQSFGDLPGHKYTINVTVTDVDTSQVPVITLFYGPTLNQSKTMVLISGVPTSGVYQANISTADGFAVLDPVLSFAFGNDTLETSNSTIGNHSIPNFLPTAPTILLTPNLPTPIDDLLCNITANSTDPDADNVSYIFTWYNGSTLKRTFGPTNQTFDILGAGNTSDAEDWNCTVTPFDGFENGTSISDIAEIREPGVGFLVVKNIVYTSETGTTVTYNVSVTAYNFLGFNLTNVTVNDTDIALNVSVNITDKLFFENLSSITIPKAAANSPFLFSTATAIANGSLFNSNQLRVLVPALPTAPIIIPGGGGGGGAAPAPGGGGGGGISACEPEWECNAWGPCINNIQNRTCIDKFNCEEKKKLGIPVLQTVKPTESQSCFPPEPIEPTRSKSGIHCALNTECEVGYFCWNGTCAAPPSSQQPKLITKTITVTIIPLYLLLLLLLVLWVWYKWYTITRLELVHHKNKKMIWRYKEIYFRLVLHEEKTLRMLLELSREKKKAHKEETILTKFGKKIGFAIRCKEIPCEPITTTILLDSLKWRIKHELKKAKKNTARRGR